MSHAKIASCLFRVDASGQVSETARKSILHDYSTLGYALFQLDSAEQDPTRVLHRFTQSLNLGEAFVPPLYQFSNSNLYDDLGMSTLASAFGNGPNSVHPVFASASAIELHTDGTLQNIGDILTSVLFCVAPAWEGGETTIFQAVNVFIALQQAEPQLASALLDRRALTRHASVNGSKESCQGPVFSRAGGVLQTRYSVTDRDRWNVDEVADLLEAKNALADAAQTGSPHYCRIRLGLGQGVILANDRVSHGRTGFSDSTDQVRRMLRVLFARQPQ